MEGRKSGSLDERDQENSGFGNDSVRHGFREGMAALPRFAATAILTFCGCLLPPENTGDWIWGSLRRAV